MNEKQLISTPRRILKIISYIVCLILLTGVTGCMGKYGNFKMDQEVLHAFENNTVNSEYKYYANYQHNETYAIIGIESKYKNVA